MFPTLFEIFGWKVPSYAVMMGLGYVAALYVIFRLANRTDGVERWQAWDLFIVMVVASLLGSKLGHTLFEAPGHIDYETGEKITSLWQLLTSDPWHWARLDEGGYVWYGGMVAALVTATVYFKRRPDLDPWLYSDLFAPAIMAGAVVGRLGCFMAGCCYGEPTDAAWGVKFPRVDHAVHPTQLYDAGIALVLAIVLYTRFAKRKFTGENIAVLLILYPILRSLTEVFRGDADRGAFGGLSTSQWISIPLFAIGVWLFVTRQRRSSAPAPAE